MKGFGKKVCWVCEKQNRSEDDLRVIYVNGEYRDTVYLCPLCRGAKDPSVTLYIPGRASKKETLRRMAYRSAWSERLGDAPVSKEA